MQVQNHIYKELDLISLHFKITSKYYLVISLYYLFD
jgi:hypothetical protein